jgi:hypothetical protein
MLRYTLGLFFILAACDSQETQSTLCDDLRTEQASCMNDENYQQCQDAVETCGDAVRIMESCPLQFGC